MNFFFRIFEFLFHTGGTLCKTPKIKLFKIASYIIASYIIRELADIYCIVPLPLVLVFLLCLWARLLLARLLQVFAGLQLKGKLSL